MGSLLVCHPLLASHPKTASSRPRKPRKRRLKVGHNQLVNSLAGECEKLFAVHEICAELQKVPANLILPVDEYSRAARGTT
jgi:hypothetical protein